MNVAHEKLLNQILVGKSDKDKEKLKKAFAFAEKKHAGQKRVSGEDFIVHPLEVANILVDLGIDTATLVAALLHDTLEDTETTKEELAKSFGSEVSKLVDGVTNLGTIDLSKIPDGGNIHFRADVENLRKLFLAMAKDIRVVLIKLADRLHNMRTIGSLSVKRQSLNATETLEIYVPLADRLGMGGIKAELEDLSFRILNFDGYNLVAKKLEETRKERSAYLAKIKKVLAKDLKTEGISAQIDGRIKHLYSIYRKLDKVDGDFSKIYDLMAVRIVVENVEDCYRVLGIIHKKYKPLIYRIKDYIAVPKPNGYKSLHTTVFGPDGKISEIQIRTKEMHDEAENGIAAHWYYNQAKSMFAYKNKIQFLPTKKLGWVAKIIDWQKNAHNDQEFLDGLKIDAFNEHIYVYTPKGDLFELPRGASPVDFAYEIHTQIGHRCRGAKVNGKIVPLTHKLENRDVVDIILAPKKDKPIPSRGWLEFVKTAKARQNIRSYFKGLHRDENIDEGKKLLNSELASFEQTENALTELKRREVTNDLRYKSWEDILVAIGDGTLTAKQIVKRIVGQRVYLEKLEQMVGPIETGRTSEKTKETSNMAGILIRHATCCKPVKGDKVMGFITRGYGITVHKATCKNLLSSEKERIIDLSEFEFEVPTTHNMNIEVIAKSRVGLISDVSSVVSKEKINIISIKSESNGKESRIVMKLPINFETFADLVTKLRQVEGVVSVKNVSKVL